MKMIKPKAPQLKGRMKTHKLNIPIRPVVNYRNAPCYKLAKFLNYKLKSYMTFGNNYSLLNNYELINKIKDVQIPNNSVFISFDITNMYSNVPIKETLQIISQNLSKTRNYHLVISKI